jgi:long-chain acyl-CoA synthetase
MPGVEVRLDPGGQVLVRGGNVCLGYHGDPAASAALLEGGWLHTGDLGSLDQEGYLTITGRC